MISHYASDSARKIGQLNGSRDNVVCSRNLVTSETNEKTTDLRCKNWKKKKYFCVSFTNGESRLRHESHIQKTCEKSSDFKTCHKKINFWVSNGES